MFSKIHTHSIFLTSLLSLTLPGFAQVADQGNLNIHSLVSNTTCFLQADDVLPVGVNNKSIGIATLNLGTYSTTVAQGVANYTRFGNEAGIFLSLVNADGTSCNTTSTWDVGMDLKASQVHVNASGKHFLLPNPSSNSVTGVGAPLNVDTFGDLLLGKGVPGFGVLLSGRASHLASGQKLRVISSLFKLDTNPTVGVFQTTIPLNVFYL